MFPLAPEAQGIVAEPIQATRPPRVASLAAVRRDIHMAERGLGAGTVAAAEAHSSPLRSPPTATSIVTAASLPPTPAGGGGLAVSASPAGQHVRGPRIVHEVQESKVRVRARARAVARSRGHTRSQADMYGLGCILFQLLFGTAPPPTLRETQRSFLARIGLGVGTVPTTVLERLLADDPEERWGADELLNFLAAVEVVPMPCP